MRDLEIDKILYELYAYVVNHVVTYPLYESL